MGPPHSLCSTLVPNILRLTDSPQYSTHTQVTLLHWSFPNLPLHTPLLRLLMLLSTPHPDSSTAMEEDHPSEITLDFTSSLPPFPSLPGPLSFPSSDTSITTTPRLREPMMVPHQEP